MKKIFMPIITIAVMALAACGGGAEQPKQELPNYEIVKLKPVDRTVSYQFPATLKGKTEVQVFPQIEGRITAIYYENGTVVKKGQPLVCIDDTQRRLTMQTAKAAVDAADAAKSTAKLQLESQKNLHAKNIVSDYVLQTAENNYKTACANLSQAKAQLAIAESELAKCIVTSPINGIVVGKPYKVGALVGPAMLEPITTVTDQKVVYASLAINEETYQQLFTKYGARQTSTGIKSADGKSMSDFYKFKLKMKDGTFYSKEGRLTTVSGTLDANTGTAQVNIDFDNPDLILHAGMSVSIIMPEEAKGVLVLPQTACKRLQDKYLAYKVDKNGNALGVIVDVVPTDDGKEYIIMSGLKADDEVIANGVTRITEGQKIK